ncbi:lipopolysaccharide biosynthesis protein [Paraglaciecola marina]|uniref:lipopolysaccharide biosynthesis protein n=1 Tax=Paraglaciecola marina TaxID=2500157 RepID=UPI00105E4012|nr:lipopolysaccharide biosynthesis protein [Paraglaciecola marina]
MPKSLVPQVFKASSWLMFTRVVITVLSMTSIFILARLLTPEDFGLVAIASVVATLLQSMVQIPVSQALIAIKNPTKAHFDTAFTINIIRTTLICLVLLVSAIPIANFYNEPKVTQILIIFSVAAFADGFINPKFVIFEKSLNFSYIFFTSVLSKLLATGASLAIAYYTQSYWALVIGSVITQLLNVIFTYYFLPYLPRFSLKKNKEILSFSVWVSLSHIINNINWKLDQLLIGKFFGTVTLGVYNIGNELASMPTRETTTPLNRALFPAFSQLLHKPERFTQAYLTSISIFYSILLPIGFGLVLVAEPMVLLALGEKWQGAILVIEILAGIYAVACITSVTKAIAMATGKTKIIFKRDVLFFIVKVVLSLGGLYIYGFFGLLYSKLLNLIFLLVYNFFLVRYLLNVGIVQQLTVLCRPVLSVCVMYFTMLLLKSQLTFETTPLDLMIELSLLCTAGALTYCSCHFLIWIMQGKPQGIEQKLSGIVNKKLKRDTV